MYRVEIQELQYIVSVPHGNARICNTSCTPWHAGLCNTFFTIWQWTTSFQSAYSFSDHSAKEETEVCVLNHQLHTTQKFCNLHTHILITQSELNDLVWSSPRTRLGFWVPGCNSGISWQIMIEFLFFRTVKSFLSHSFTKRVIFLLAWHFWYGNPQNELQRR